MFNMGQSISSNTHHHQNHSNNNNNNHDDSNSVIYRERQNATLPLVTATTATTGGSGGGSAVAGSNTADKIRRGGLDLARVRPVTMSGPPSNFNAERELKKLEIVSSKPAITITVNSTTIEQQQQQQQQNSSAIENGYHKTDYCYYRTPQGNFHKLPTDSYHKMSEGCYIRLADGNFRRLHLLDVKSGLGKKFLDPNGGGNNSNRNSMTIHLSNNNNSHSGSTNNNGRNLISGAGGGVGDKSSSKVKSQMMKFLKRSKSHTPATVKQMQSYHKEGSYIDRKLNNKLGHDGTTPLNALTTVKEGTVSNTTSTNNKVVVTMMENGGLPIVATSKAEKFKNRESAGTTKAKKVHVYNNSVVSGQSGSTQKYNVFIYISKKICVNVCAEFVPSYSMYNYFIHRSIGFLQFTNLFLSFLF